MNIIARRKLWYTISLSVLVPAVIVLAGFGLRLGIDFTGGSILEVRGASREQALAVAESQSLQNVTVTTSGDDTILLRYRLPETAADDTQTQLETELTDQPAEIISFNEVGPSVSGDLVKNAIYAITAMSLAIVAYITWVFRRVPSGVSALSFGLTAIAALLHDALFVLGVFALLGWLFKVEVDSYIVTAILTVIGFSVHDTIVVFDRIRENLGRSQDNFEKLVNTSLQETLVRSLNTSLVVVFVLLALFLFGGTSTRYFVLALLLGMIAGTYSSLFVAAPLLVSWHNRRHKRLRRRAATAAKPN